MKRFIHRHQPIPVMRVVPLAGLGAFLAVLSLSFFSTYSSLPLMMAPFGASCVLLFASHTSPLSQPINVIGGHMVSAAIGLMCAWIFPASFIMASAAVGIALMVMMLLRVVHPPAGATALVAYSSTAGFAFILFPVLMGSVALVILAYVYHKFMQAQYPVLPSR